MFGGYLTRRGRSGGMGIGFRGSSPPYPYVGRGRGGLPRCQYPDLGSATTMPTYNREQELDFLKNQAGEIKRTLERVGSRIRDLEENKKDKN